MFEKKVNNKGQVTIFIIISVILVAVVIGYFIFRGAFTIVTVPANLQPVYTSFLACIEESASEGVSILGAQGGYIGLPNFEPGSAHMPFSSQLNFLGNPVPYWYYVSGNNIEREQVPSVSDMERDLGNYIESRISSCILDSYFEQGFAITLGSPSAKVNIKDNEVDINLDMDLTIERAEEIVTVRTHNTKIFSKLGSLYKSAREIYDYQQKTLFLENYAIDTLYLYAPVDGVELTCGPKVWNAQEVFENLSIAFEANTLALRAKSNDFRLVDDSNKYFVLDLPVNEEVRFLNSRSWPYSYEVNPSDGAILSANPVGTNPAMSMAGFCYVPYHFVYDIKYPVLVQVYSGMEIFQFPMGVVIQGNMPRQALDFEGIVAPDAEVCTNYNTPMHVHTYDTYLDPVSAHITFQCLGQTCPIGKTEENGTLLALFPQCVNGFAVAKADGYLTASEQVYYVDDYEPIYIILKKTYEKTINLKVDGRDYNRDAIISFIYEDGESSRTIMYPEQKSVELTSGQYEISVSVYGGGDIKLQRTVQEQCADVPTSVLGGIFGMTRKKCFDIVIPETTISNVLLGGGVQKYYISESELETSTTIDINSDSLPVPRTVEDLQKNFITYEAKGLNINFI